MPDELMAALASGEPARLARALHNDLQEAALDLRPELGDADRRAGRPRARCGAGVGVRPDLRVPLRLAGRLPGLVTALSASYDVVLSAIGPVAGAHVVSTREAEWDLR